MFAVFVEEAVIGLAGPEFEVILAAASGDAPQVVEHKRCSDNGGAGVEAIAVTLDDVGFSAWLIGFLEDLDAVATGGEANCRAETAKACADDDDVLLHGCSLETKLLR